MIFAKYKKCFNTIDIYSGPCLGQIASRKRVDA